MDTFLWSAVQNGKFTRQHKGQYHSVDTAPEPWRLPNAPAVQQLFGSSLSDDAPALVPASGAEVDDVVARPG